MAFKKILINEMEIFYQVVTCHGFARAAQQLGVSASHVSKKITQLEADLGVNLLIRSTRQMTLTEAGEAFYQHCRRVVEQAQRGYDLIAELQGSVTGTLKIAAPAALGTYVLPTVIATFTESNPDVTLQLVLSSRLEDVIAGGFDLVLRSAALVSSNLIAQKIWDIDSVVCATPAYWQRYGQPAKPFDLSHFPYVQYAQTASPRPLTFLAARSHDVVTLQPSMYCSILSAMHAVIKQDLYFAVLPRFMVEDDLSAGVLESALNDFRLQSSPLYAVYPKRDFLPPKVSVFLTTLKQYLHPSNFN